MKSALQRLYRRALSLVVRLKNHSSLLRAIEWTKTHSLPGLKRIPIYNLVAFVIKETEDDAIVTRANSIAFSFFLAIFPGIIFLVTLLPYFPYGVEFFDTIEDAIKEVMPGEAGAWVFSSIADLLKTERPNLLSFGFVLALWFASNGMVSMMNSFEKDYEDTFRSRGFMEKRLVAFQLTFLLSFILFASVVLIILGGTILNTLFTYIKTDFITRWAAFTFRWFVVCLLFYAGISTIYRYGVATRRKLSFFNPGALLATTLSILTSWFFSFYVDNFGEYNKVYGSIGALIVLMLWIQLNCLIVLIGFELNAAIVVLRDRRSRLLERQPDL